MNEYIITPETIISDLIDYSYIYDEYLEGIEELVEKEMGHCSTEILDEEDKDAYEDPQYCPTEISIYRNYKGTDGYFVMDELPSLIRGSALVSLFSIFESNIKHICDRFFCFSPIKLKYDYIAGNDALKKLKTVVKILNNKIIWGERIYHINEKVFQNDSYNIIKNMWAIRNCFAHANGKIRDEKAKIVRMNKKIEEFFKINAENNQVIILRGA